jgi:hypothetical protein
MKKKIELLICVMLFMTIFPISTIQSEKIENSNENVDTSKWFFNCYVEIDGLVFASTRNLFLPHINDKDDTFCLRWVNRFCDNSSVLIYSEEGGDLIYNNEKVKEFHMIWFLGKYNYRGDPLSLKGNAFCIKCFDEWT